jgi:hypothetical protein
MGAVRPRRRALYADCHPQPARGGTSREGVDVNHGEHSQVHGSRWSLRRRLRLLVRAAVAQVRRGVFLCGAQAIHGGRLAAADTRAEDRQPVIEMTTRIWMKHAYVSMHDAPANERLSPWKQSSVLLGPSSAAYSYC